MGCPIRKSAGQSLFAAHRSLSQLTTSFFASQSQGIHRMLLSFPLGNLRTTILPASSVDDARFVLSCHMDSYDRLTCSCRTGLMRQGQQTLSNLKITPPTSEKTPHGIEARRDDDEPWTSARASACRLFFKFRSVLPWAEFFSRGSPRDPQGLPLVKKKAA